MHCESIVIFVNADVMNECMWNESRLSPITQYHLSKSFITLSINIYIYKIEVLLSNMLESNVINWLIEWDNEKVGSKEKERRKEKGWNIASKTRNDRFLLARLIINYQRERATNAFQRRRRGIYIGKWCNSVSGIEWPKGSRPCTVSRAGSDPANVSRRLYLEACWSRPPRGCRFRIPVYTKHNCPHVLIETFRTILVRLKSLIRILLELLSYDTWKLIE